MLHNFHRFCLTLLVLFMATEGIAQESSKKVYLIGNSLTWDTLPVLLGEGVEWHVDCGKNLQYLYDNPQEPCVKSSVTWPEALKTEQYDILCVQPHFGTTLKQDVEVIGAWLKMQPKADLLIHTGWNRNADFEAVYHASIDHDRMVHAPVYFERLVGELRKKFPSKTIRTTQAVMRLDEIYHEIEKGETPFKSFTDLYRDDIHLSHHVGRYFVHNLMRLHLGRPLSDQGFQIEASHKAYFDRKLAEVEQSLSPPNEGSR
jgi:hypothetical protein